MDYRPLDINVTCMQGLKATNLFCKKRLYVVVSIVGNSQSRQETPIGRYKGNDPIWNYAMRFYLEDLMLQQNRLMVVFQIRCSQILGGDKSIGEVYVPVRDLLYNCTTNDKDTQYGVYQVVTRTGKPRGCLYFSYKFGNMIRAIKNVDHDNVRACSTRMLAPCATPSAPYLEDHGAHPPPSAPYVGYLG